MKPKICIVGATGELGKKLLNYCYKNNIDISCITFFNNKKKALKIKEKFDIKNYFSLKDNHQKNLFIKYLCTNYIDIIYFLDCGSYSLKYVDLYLNKNSRSYIAIANKELIVSGGSLLINKIKKSKNIFIPLDSEHFSLFEKLTQKYLFDDIKKIYITASGGPFYFKKNIDLNSVSLKDVLNHPKWKMGVNNTIDSSNFVNKLLEIFELSIIFKIDIGKISFVLSHNAFIHSIVEKNDGTISFNCFNNDMMITLLKPISYFYKLNYNFNYSKIFNIENFQIEKFNDKRFYLLNNLNKFKKMKHSEIIRFMILNNRAHTKYLNGQINYNYIVPFINNHLIIDKEKKYFKSFDDILEFIEYEKNIIKSL